MLTASVWFWPLVAIVAGFVLAGAVADAATALDVPVRDLTAGAAAVAPTLLATMAAAEITMLTFFISTLMIVFTFASAQLSPRLLNPLVWHGHSQPVLASMFGTFVYLLRALMLSYGTREPTQPAALAAVGALLVLMTLFGLLYFASAVLDWLRTPRVILRLAAETATSLESVYRTQRGMAGPVEPPELPIGEPAYTVRAQKDGSVTEIDREELLAWATANDAVVVVTAGLGTHVSQGGRLADVYGVTAPPESNRLRGAFAIEWERTVQGDPPYGFRLLVDIANRALSPAINDPTTAAQVLDALQDLLVLVAERPEQPGHIFDNGGRLRVLVPEMRWQDYLLMLQEIIEYGASSSQVSQRLARLLDELADGLSGDRQRAVRELRARVVPVLPLIASALPG